MNSLPKSVFDDAQLEAKMCVHSHKLLFCALNSLKVLPLEEVNDNQVYKPFMNPISPLRKDEAIQSLSIDQVFQNAQSKKTQSGHFLKK